MEHDSLGSLRVPAKMYFGIQTARAVKNFPLSGVAIGAFPSLITALAFVKRAAAHANAKMNLLPREKLAAIIGACDDVVAGKIDVANFPVDVFQGGAGTSTNMNMNEVIANRALERLGFARGAYSALHPNDDVNLSQSTNDVYPTAVRVAIILSHSEISDAAVALADAFELKARELENVVKLGRTQLQDAIPMTLGQEFRAFSVTMREDVKRLSESVELLHEINLGGTAIGTGLNAGLEYSQEAVKELGRLIGAPLIQAEDLIAACWDTGALVHYSSVLKRLAIKISKICNDLRLLSSGPRSGFGEIRLPPRQAGSSIMPGKINPVIPEAANQVCFQVIANDFAVVMAAQGGQLQLNAFEPLIAFNILSSTDLMSSALHMLRNECVAGIEAESDRCRFLVEASPSLVTALTPLIGYDAAASIAKTALRDGQSIRECAINQGMDPDTVDRLLDPIAMARPHTRSA